MKGRWLLALGLLLAIAANTLSGVNAIMAFRHRHAGELALATADLDAALEHLTSARRWMPGDAPTSVLIGRVIQQAQANGLPLEALAGHQQMEVFAIGLSATIHGIEMNPADAWAWFNLVDVFQSLRSARMRLDAMRKAGEAVGAPVAPPVPAVASGLSPEDRVSLAAVFQAIEMEPQFHFYRDYLARLYWDRGMKADAAREIRLSMKQWPRVEIHPALESQQLLTGLQGPIFEGIEAAARDPLVGPAQALRAKAMLLERLEKLDEAVVAYGQLREVADPDLAAQCDLEIGKLLVALGKFRESMPVLTRALGEIRDDNTSAWADYYLGMAHSGLGDHDRAAELLRRHTQKLEKSLPGYLALAAEEEALGNYDAAEALYIQSVVNHPTETIGYVRVIEHMRKHGRQKQAVAYAEGLRKISADPSEADELLRILRVEIGTRAP